MSLEGRQIGKYSLLHLVGRGGMGEVYVAEDSSIKRQVAIKVVLYNNQGKELTRLFLREIQVIAHLDHPYILPLFEYGQDTLDRAIITYLVMPYRSLGSLEEWLKKRSQLVGSAILPLDFTAFIIGQAAEALQYAHTQNIIHLDVKPSNFLVRANEEASGKPMLQLTDFGLSKLTTTSQNSQAIRGTPIYMAPEQWEGNSTFATDQYALAVMSYKLLTGMELFKGQMAQMMYQHLHAEPVSPNKYNPYLPHEVSIVLSRALSKKPEDRFTSISEFSHFLRKALLSGGTNYANVVSTGGSSITRPSRDVCTYCKTKLAQEEEFCLNCGLQNPLYNAQQSSDGPYKCPHCQTEISPQDEFCPNCGLQNAKYQHSTLVAPTFYSMPISDESIPSFNAWPGTYGAPPALDDKTQSANDNSYDEEQSFVVGARQPPGLPLLPGLNQATGNVNNSDAPTAFASFPAFPSGFNPTFATPGPSPTIEDLFGVAERHLKAKEFQAAFDIYAQIIDIDGQNMLAYYRFGKALEKARRYQDALVIYDAALTVDPNDFSIWKAKGDLLSSKIKKREEEALEAYNRAISIRPEDGALRAIKGHIFLKLELYEEALDAYSQALDFISRTNIDVYFVVLLAKCRVHYELKQYENALIAYERIPKSFLKKAVVWDERGDILHKLGRYEDALDAYGRALALDPLNRSIAKKCDMLRDFIKHLRSNPPPAQVISPPSDLQSPSQSNKEDAQQGNKPVSSRPSLIDENIKASHPSKMDTILNTQVEEQFAKPQVSHDSPFVSRTPLPEAKKMVPSTPKEPDKHDEEQQKENEEKTKVLEPYDVFLSYSRADEKWVEALAKRLKDEHQFKVWLDKWVLVAGQPFQTEMAQGIDLARSCAVCIGPTMPDGWFMQEIQKIVNRKAKDIGLRVIPVLLPGAQEENVIDFLGLNTWVDFRNDPERAFYELECGIRNKPPGRWPREERTMGKKKHINADDMLRDLRRMRDEDLIPESIRQETIRVVIETFVIPEWKKQKDYDDA